MTKFKKAVLGAATALALAAPVANAGLVNVGGVIWNPDKTPPNADFTGRYQFYQWFTSDVDAVSSTPNASPDLSDAINPATIDPAAKNSVLQGVAEFDFFNGVSLSPSDIDGLGGGFCPSCELTVVFGGFKTDGLDSSGNVKFTNGWFNIYVDDTPDFKPGVGPFDESKAADGALFLSLEATLTTFDSSAINTGNLSAFVKVTGGLAKDNFDTNPTFPIFPFMLDAPAGSDLKMTANADFTVDDLDGDGNVDYYATANGIARGNTIPEPATLALLGLGLLGMGGLSASRKRAKA